MVVAAIYGHAKEKLLFLRFDSMTLEDLGQKPTNPVAFTQPNTLSIYQQNTTIGPVQAEITSKTNTNPNTTTTTITITTSTP